MNLFMLCDGLYYVYDLVSRNHTHPVSRNVC